MRLTFFGSSLVSSYWNGAATYYRGLLRALTGWVTRSPSASRTRTAGRSTATWRRTRSTPGWWSTAARGSATTGGGGAGGERLGGEVQRGGGVGRELEEAVARGAAAPRGAPSWTWTPPPPWAGCDDDPADPFRALIPRFDHVFTYGGGPPVVAALPRARGARVRARSTTGSTRRSTARWSAPARRSTTSSSWATGCPDREARVEEFFLRAAGAGARGALRAGRRGLGRQADAAERRATWATSPPPGTTR